MARRIYPPELEDYVREHFKEYTAAQLAPRIKEDLGIDMTPSQVHAYTQNHGIHYGRSGKKMPERRITTPEMDAFIREHIKGTGHQEMADLVNDRFGSSFTKEQMKAYYARNKLDSGITGHFVKGQESWNKGLKQTDFMSSEAIERTKATRFQKGNIPHNGGAPVGEIRIRHDHKNRKNGKPYYWQKTKQPNVWRMKHIVEWEEHNGSVPKGYIVGFADGDTLNWHIENLYLLTRAQNAVKNRWGIKGYDKESAETANLIADLKIATNKAKRRKK